MLKNLNPWQDTTAENLKSMAGYPPHKQRVTVHLTSCGWYVFKEYIILGVHHSGMHPCWEIPVQSNYHLEQWCCCSYLFLPVGVIHNGSLTSRQRKERASWRWTGMGQYHRTCTWNLHRGNTRAFSDEFWRRTRSAIRPFMAILALACRTRPSPNIDPTQI